MDVKIIFKGGGSFVSHRPVFSTTAENVYVAWKNLILGYSTKTGNIVSKLTGIVDPIMGFGIHHYDSYECITACSTSGQLITWKTVTHFKLLNKKIGINNVKTFHLIPSESDEIQALVSYETENKIKFCLCDPVKCTKRDYKLKLRTGQFFVDVSSRNYFAVAQSQALQIMSINNFVKITSHCIENSRHFTCISCHPEEQLVLTGDSTGRVLAWQNIFANKPSQAVFHWHTLPAKCVGFSMAGSYFYSGGKECVLVRWQLDNHLEKFFLPRLPAPIRKITVSPDNMYIAIATEDNAIRIVDARFDKVSLIQHLVIGVQFESGIVLDPRTKALIMNGNIGQIQFYRVQDGSLLYNVDIVDQNKITNERNCNIENTQVRKVAISKSGLWMATVEERRDATYHPEIRLKFWSFNQPDQRYKLVTSIEYPHETRIYSILFQPTNNEDELMCVTVGDDKKFKVWRLVEVTVVNATKKSWRLLNAAYYQDLPCRALSFSADGSLVAVSFDTVVTVWSPDTCQLKSSLVHPSFSGGPAVKHLQFGRGNQCHLLVAAAADDRLNVWNLLTLSVIWTVPVKTSLLIADTVTTNMAVFTQDKKIFVFSPESPEPVFSNDKLLRNHDTIYAASFVPSKYCNDVRLKWYQRSSIYFIDSNKELFSLGEEEEEGSSDILDIYNEESLFSKMIPLHKDENEPQKDHTPVSHLFAKERETRNIHKYLDAPTHTTVPIRFLCEGLLAAMVLQKS